MRESIPFELVIKVFEDMSSLIESFLKEDSMLVSYIHWKNRGPDLHLNARMLITSLQYIEASLAKIVKIDRSD